jgi:aliphatic nitrilase
MSRTLDIGAAQVAEVHHDREATIRKDVEFIHRAGDQGLDLVVFPETHVPGNPIWSQFDESQGIEAYYQQLFENAVEIPGPAIERLTKAAAEANVAVVMGVNEREPNTAGTMYNTSVIIDADGTLVGKRRKLTPTLTERIYHTGGTGMDVMTFETSVGTVGSLLCSEHHNPLSVFATLAQGEELHAAQWPCFAWCDSNWLDRRVGVRSQYHALAGNVPTVIATGVMDDALHEALDADELSPGAGRSAVLSPEGEYLARASADEETIVHAEVDMGERTWSKAVHDIVGHYNRFDIFTLEVDRTAHDALRIRGDGDDGGGDSASEGSQRSSPALKKARRIAAEVNNEAIPEEVLLRAVKELRQES